MNKPKLFRITTVPLSLFFLLKGQLRFMNHYYDVKGVSSEDEDGLRVAAAENEGVEIIPIEMTRTISPIKDLKSVWALYKLFKKEKPLIVHTHTPKAGTVGMLAAKLAGVPNRLHTIAGLPLLETTGPKRRLLDLVEKATYACATKIYPNSKGLHDIILENKYTRAEKLKVIGQGSTNGIDTSHFDPAALKNISLQKLKDELGIHEDDFVFVFVGRLVQDKGINELLYAFQMLSEKISTVKLLLVGFFEKELDPLNFVSERILASNKSIIYAGFQKDVRPYFAISDALAFPSYREGFPNVVMQAGAMGLPSIVSDINGCNEIIIEGENGTIIPVKNEDALYDAMLKFMEEKEYYFKLKDKARPMICNRYEQKVVWEALLEEYKSLEDKMITNV